MTEIFLNSPSQPQRSTPDLIFETLNAYQRTSALKAAIELDVFTAIGEGAGTVAEIARRTRASERGVRALCDYLVVFGFLTKQGSGQESAEESADAPSYALSADAAKFLDRRSPACIASTIGFLALPTMTDAFKDFADVVRSGKPHVAGGAGTTGPEDPIWVDFAIAMAPMQAPLAEFVARIVSAESRQKWKVLDIAAGHGAFGTAIARHNPNAEIFALDWPQVLKVARDNANAAGIGDRFHELPGSAFDIELGGDYDIILVTNFLQLFDPPAIERLMRKVHAALKPNGRAVTLGFIPNEDRVTPPAAAAFAISMLGTTSGGDAYSFPEYVSMFRHAGFTSNEFVPLPAGPQSVIVSRK
ncbi:MAG TPA: class I SAM-dependent methyltransferase [Candidatus Acidoferrales bacterium]